MRSSNESLGKLVLHGSEKVDAEMPGKALQSLAHEGKFESRREEAARRHGRCLIGVESDAEAVAFYLRQKADSPRTFQAYEREVGRFWLWCQERGLTDLDEIVAQDVHRYQEALKKGEVETPKERKRRITWLEGGLRELDDGKPNYPQASSVNYSIGILSAMFEYLFKVRYLTGNVFVALKKVPEVRGSGKVERFLTKRDWEELMATVEALRQDTGRHLAIYHQTRWLLCLAVLGGLRRAEAAEGWMADFHSDDAGRWWLTVTGKGLKQREVPVPSKLLQELKVYRGWLRDASCSPELPDLPGQDCDLQDVPLVCRIDGKFVQLEGRRIGRIVGNVVAKTAARIREAGDPARADLFKRISTHWLRHTGVTEVANGSDVHTAQKYAGHADVRTTILYTHDEDEAMHDKVTGAYERSKLFAAEVDSAKES